MRGPEAEFIKKTMKSNLPDPKRDNFNPFVQISNFSSFLPPNFFGFDRRTTAWMQRTLLPHKCERINSGFHISASVTRESFPYLSLRAGPRAIQKGSVAHANKESPCLLCAHAYPSVSIRYSGGAQQPREIRIIMLRYPVRDTKTCIPQDAPCMILSMGLSSVFRPLPLSG